MWSAKEALRTSPFWLLFVAQSLSGLPSSGMQTQIVMWGVDLGEPLATAGVFMTAFTLPSVLSRILGGWLGDRYGKRRLLILAYCVCLLVMVGAWLTIGSRSSLFIKLSSRSIKPAALRAITSCCSLNWYSACSLISLADHSPRTTPAARRMKANRATISVIFLFILGNFLSRFSHPISHSN